MRLHLNFPLHFNMGNMAPKVTVVASFIPVIEPSKKSFLNTIKKTNNSFRKLSPLHWYDGVWDDLDYKM